MTNEKTNKLSQLLAATTQMPVTVFGITVNCEVLLNSYSYAELMDRKKQSSKEQAETALKRLLSAEGETEAEQLQNTIKHTKELIEAIDGDYSEATKLNYDFVIKTCKSWDLDDGEKILPVTAETLGSLPFEFLEEYSNAYANTKKSLSGKLPTTQNSSQPAANSQAE